MTRTDALTVATKHGHFFVLPWRGHTLLGTTDTAFSGDPDTLGVSESEISTFFAFINNHLPNAKLGWGNVEYFYAGLRPLVDDGSGDTYGASRRAELVDHGKDDRLDGLFSAIGGKWTTSRQLAQSVVDALAAKLGAKTRACETGTSLLPGGRVGRFNDFVKQQQPSPSLSHLARLYGARLPNMLAEAGNRPDLLSPIAPTGDIGAQVIFAMREEMALTLEDVVMRRTGIGQLGAPSRETLDTVSRLMAAELGWSEDRRAKEIATLAPWYRTREAA
jgi:glycerol-3-phosphate dehydrogenase